MHTYVRTYIHTYTARGSMDAWLSVCGAYDVHAGVQCACARADGDLRTGGGHERYTLCRTGSVRGQSSPSLRSPVGRHSQQRKRATRLREHTHTGAHLAAADDAAGHTRPDDWHLRPGTSRVRQERTDARLRKIYSRTLTGRGPAHMSTSVSARGVHIHTPQPFNNPSTRQDFAPQGSAGWEKRQDRQGIAQCTRTPNAAHKHTAQVYHDGVHAARSFTNL